MTPRNDAAARAGRAWLLLALAISLLIPAALRADDIPARPAQYFNDYAHVVDSGAAAQLNDQLANFERQTSNQIVVAVYPKMQTDDALDEYCYRIFQAWGVGQKKLDNGAVLFVFVQNHKMRIQTGYGLEGALPDVTCVRILDDEISPYFKLGDYAGGLRAGINAMIAATKGEYKGTGRTDADNLSNQISPWIPVAFIIFWLLLFVLSRRTGGMLYGSSGIGRYGGWYGGFGGGGGGFGGGGGGGGFSGGGGSSGGGGASGGW